MLPTQVRIEDVDADGDARLRAFAGGRPVAEILALAPSASDVGPDAQPAARVVDFVCDPAHPGAAVALLRAAARVVANRFGAALAADLRPGGATPWAVASVDLDGLRVSGRVALLDPAWLPRRWASPDPASESAAEFAARGNAGPLRARAAALRSLPPGSPVWAYHATDCATARRLARDGVTPYGKPYTVAAARRAAGEAVDFAPGRGLDGGIYVGSLPTQVDGYGRCLLALRVAVEDLRAPPEAAALGHADGVAAFLNDDAVVRRPVPPGDVLLLENGGRRIEDPRLAIAEAAARRDAARAPGELRGNPGRVLRFLRAGL